MSTLSQQVKNNLKEAGMYDLSFLQVFIYIIVLITTIKILQPKNYIEFIIIVGGLLLTGQTLLMYLKNRSVNGKDLTTNTLKGLLVITLFYFIIKWLGRYGVIGFIIIVLGFAGYRLIKHRGMYFKSIRVIEKNIWGETLDERFKRKNKK